MRQYSSYLGSTTVNGTLTVTGASSFDNNMLSGLTTMGENITGSGTRNICIIGRGHSSIVNGDTIINGIRFFPVGSEIHTARALPPDAAMARNLSTADILGGDPETYYGRIPADIRGIVRAMLQDPRGLFEITLLAAVRRGNIADVVNAMQSETCRERIPAIRAACLAAVANLPVMHRPEYLALLQLQ